MESRGKNRLNLRKAQLGMALFVWASFFTACLLFIFFVRLNSWQPRSGWWLLTTSLVVLGVVGSFVLMLPQLRGRDSLRAVAIFVFAVLPLVWFGAWIWSTINVLTLREDFELNTPTKALGVWVSSYFEFEAHMRYPQVTEGEHVVLFDDGTNPNAVQLVAEMDNHIDTMAKTLEASPPPTKIRWVRGDLFGQSGRAIGPWAICGNENPDSLDSLDRHEVAHATITLMCSLDQEMPMLFAEGWAETQSSEIERKILGLLDTKKLGEAKSLNQIIVQNYGGSTGPAYEYGGPFVWYLLQRFGGGDFVELYGEVRRDTFAEDVHRIVGVSWTHLEEGFWVWLEDQREWAIAKKKEKAEAAIFKLDREEDRERWLEMLTSAKANKSALQLPAVAAISVIEESKSWLRESRVLMEDGCLWKLVVHKRPFPESISCQIATPKVNGHFEQKEGNVVRNPHWFTYPSAKFTTDFEMEHWFRRNSLSEILMVDFDTMDAMSDQEVLIHSIDPIGESGLWKFRYSIIDTIRDSVQKVEALIDPENHFDAVEFSVAEKDGSRVRHQFQIGQLGGCRLVETWTMNDLDGEKTFEMSLRELSSEEAGKLKDDVEEFVASAEREPEYSQASQPEEVRKTLAETLVTPSNLAIGWPTLGLLLLVLDWVCARFRWKLNAA